MDKIEALAEMVCRGGDEPDTKSMALLVLMATLEDSSHPKALANTAKHRAFNHCAERNLCGMVDAEISVLQAELFCREDVRGLATSNLASQFSPPAREIDLN